MPKTDQVEKLHGLRQQIKIWQVWLPREIWQHLGCVQHKGENWHSLCLATGQWCQSLIHGDLPWMNLSTSQSMSYTIHVYIYIYVIYIYDINICVWYVHIWYEYVHIWCMHEGSVWPINIAYRGNCSMFHQKTHCAFTKIINIARHRKKKSPHSP